MVIALRARRRRQLELLGGRQRLPMVANYRLARGRRADTAWTHDLARRALRSRRAQALQSSLVLARRAPTSKRLTPLLTPRRPTAKGPKRCCWCQPCGMSKRRQTGPVAAPYKPSYRSLAKDAHSYPSQLSRAYRRSYQATEFQPT